MAEDQDKSQQTEEPTAKRLEQAREHGDVVKSTEVTAFILLGGGTLAIAIFGKYTALGLARTLSLFLEQPEAMRVAGVAADMSRLLFKVLMASLASLGVIGGLDYFWQRMRWLSRNRMSKQEIKEEYRQNEGDPAIKAKIRQLRHERSKKRMMAAVPK